MGVLGALMWSVLPPRELIHTTPAEEPTPEPEPEQASTALPASYTVELEGVEGHPRRHHRRTRVDLRPINGREQTVEVVYNLHEVTRPISVRQLRDGPEWMVGVRLLLGEVGAWRLREGRWSLLESVGILETVHNRLEPDLANPLRIAGVATWPGCGQGGTFSTCIDPKQYYGLASDRALRPRVAVPDERELNASVDIAVAAWFVFEEALFGEITAGATSFVHLCGGAGYGRSHHDCSRPGDKPNHGPVVFRGPSAWLPKQGRYALEALGVVDFVEGAPSTSSKAYVDYLLATDAAVFADAATREPPR